MDARRLLGNLLLLHSGIAGGTRYAAAFRACGYCYGSDGACASLRGVADLFHQPHFPINQRQSHRGSHCP